MNLSKRFRIQEYKEGFRVEILDRYNWYGKPIWKNLLHWSGLEKKPIYYDTYYEAKKYFLYFLSMSC